MEQTCPNCDRHCPVSALHCGRGREYFGVAGPSDGGEHAHRRVRGRSDIEPRAVQLLRACGRRLHHGHGDPAALVAPLTARELQTLERLLEKCLYDDSFQG